MRKWKIFRNKLGMVGLEAAIILIAFVIIAGAFSFMVINQGLFATERGKAAVQEGMQQASTPLSVDGSVLLRSTGPSGINAIVIPLRAYGVKYVAMATSQTAVTAKVGDYAWSNIYEGTGSVAEDDTFDDLVSGTTADRAKLFIKNSNGDYALDSNEKGFLVIHLSAVAGPRTHVIVEIRPEKAAPLTVDFYVPESLQTGWIMVSG